METPSIGPKDVEENRIIGFDFSSELAAGENIIGTPNIEVTTFAGTDPSPSAILSGGPVVVGTMVKQRVMGGLANCTYHLHCSVVTDASNDLVVAGNLPVVIL